MNDKIQMDSYKASEILFKIIKPTKIAEYTDMSYSTMLRKSKKAISRGKTQEFTKKNIAYLNESIHRISEELKAVRIFYVKYPTESFPDTKTQMAEIKEYFQPAYIYNKLGKPLNWYSVRLRPYSKEIKNYYFSEEDVLNINLAIREAANFLDSISII